MVSSLFLLHAGTNTGYAIGALETLFFEAGLELADGNPEMVHFGYPDLDGGAPGSLPRDFPNVIKFSFADTRPQNVACLCDYVRDHGIGLVVLFDAQARHPLYAPLRAAGVRTIISYWGAPISSLNPWWKLVLKRLEMRWAPSTIDGLIFESYAMAATATQGRGVARRMIDVVPLGVDVQRYRPAASNYAHRNFGIPLERRIVVYAGHMETRKGISVLVQAAVDLLERRGRRDVCFLLFGNKDDESRPFERLYMGRACAEWIRFCGYRSDLPDIFRSSFCGVIPSTGWDSFTATAVELAASGLPVVASRLQGLVEATLDEETGLLFETGNAAALADCLERLLDSPEEAARLGRNGRARCERELNRDVQRRRFVSVLRKRLQERSA